MEELDKLKIRFADATLQLELADSLYKKTRNDLIKALNKTKVKDETDT